LRLPFAVLLLATAAPAAALPDAGGTAGMTELPALRDGPILVPPKTAYVDPSLRPAIDAAPVVEAPGIDMVQAVRISAKWGRVTSVHRSPAHNRRVGGVPNSYHLSGRAIDVARRPGVNHAQIAAALRAAGHNLVESLDEGDHSHFAFGRPGERPRLAEPAAPLVQLASADEDGRLRLRLVLPTPSGGGQ
jgi:hypothetical protein